MPSLSKKEAREFLDTVGRISDERVIYFYMMLGSAWPTPCRRHACHGKHRPAQASAGDRQTHECVSLHPAKTSTADPRYYPCVHGSFSVASCGFVRMTIPTRVGMRQRASKALTSMIPS